MMGKYNSNLLSVVKIKNRGDISMKKAILLGLFLAVVLCGFSAPVAQATLIAVTFDNLNSGGGNVNQPETLGWQFTVSGSSIAVTNLGVFDNNHPSGLDLSHGVGIWDSHGNLLVSATVLAGAVDPLVNQFRYVSIAPTKLGPGTYTIGATWSNLGDNYIAQTNTNFQTGPGITFLRDEYSAETSLLTLPTNSVGGTFDPASFGPNFEFTPVPEPTTLVLLGIGLVGLVGVRMKLKK